MFGPAGYLYVYRIYGMHVCMNVVTATEGVAEAVLLRALEPLEGITVMQQRRGREDPLHLCSGPAKLCTAFGITMADNGADVVSGELWAEDDGWRPPAIGVTTRIGLRHGADLPMRFVVEGSPYLSR
jgi:DNA-3-methyladenine glycosylase